MITFCNWNLMYSRRWLSRQTFAKRRTKIVKQLDSVLFDIATFQEVIGNTDEAIMLKLTYNYSNFKFTRMKKGALTIYHAIFWKSDRFKSANPEEISLDNQEHPFAIACLLEDENGKYLIVSVHLDMEFKTKRLQEEVLRNYVDKKVKSIKDLKVIVSGDFNTFDDDKEYILKNWTMKDLTIKRPMHNQFNQRTLDTFHAMSYDFDAKLGLGSKKTHLDHIFTNLDFISKTNTVEVSQNKLSDHYMLLVDLK